MKYFYWLMKPNLSYLPACMRDGAVTHYLEFIVGKSSHYPEDLCLYEEAAREWERYGTTFCVDTYC